MAKFLMCLVSLIFSLSACASVDTHQAEVPQNAEQAAKWYINAAMKGDAEAQSALGLMYYLGKGVKQDVKQSYIWASLAAINGNDKAKSFIDSYVVTNERILTHKDIIDAEAISLRCFVSHYQDCAMQ